MFLAYWVPLLSPGNLKIGQKIQHNLNYEMSPTYRKYKNCPGVTIWVLYGILTSLETFFRGSPFHIFVFDFSWDILQKLTFPDICIWLLLRYSAEAHLSRYLYVTFLETFFRDSPFQIFVFGFSWDILQRLTFPDIFIWLFLRHSSDTHLSRYLYLTSLEIFFRGLPF